VDVRLPGVDQVLGDQVGRALSLTIEDDHA
jgi:hypothetical protein